MQSSRGKVIGISPKLGYLRSRGYADGALQLDLSVLCLA